MPNIKDDSTVEAIAQAFTSNGRDKTEALKSVGYSKSYYSTLGVGKVYSNIRVIEAIARIDAKTSRKHEHTREIAIDKLCTDYESLKTLAEGGNIQAITARTAITRELSACTGLHTSTVLDGKALEHDKLSAEDTALLKAQAKILTDSRCKTHRIAEKAPGVPSEARTEQNGEEVA